MTIPLPVNRNALFIVYFLLFLAGTTGCQSEEESSESMDDLPQITVPEGFEVTMLHSPSANGQGSWVSLTSDDQGRIIASDQYGRLYRLTVEDDDVLIDSITMEVGSAQGLLYAHGGLYVSVNAEGESGLYKLTDSDGDDKYDRKDKLVSLEGFGEHGPHGIILGPEGKSIFLIAGNHTLVPDSFSSVLHHNWREDRLFSAVLDPRGHANDIKPPGGWIARSDDQGKSWEVIASGFRNAYDIAFNHLGDLFTYDSDMEWDLGTPWYRPTRVCHVIPGAEFGWRTGSAKWPAYYPDNLPGILDVGQGSPTGIIFGYQAAFPADYQHKLFIADWSFGTIYSVELKRQGASYSASKEEFLSGTPLPVSDLIFAGDGNMYFTTGGRRGTSYLYRVRYSGEQSTAPVKPPFVLNEEQQLLRTLTSPAVSMDFIWKCLGHPDRFIRYAARVALEKEPFDTWQNRFTEVTDPQTVINAALAAIRLTDGSENPLILEKLMQIDPSGLSEEATLALVRAYALYSIRTGTHNRNILAHLPEFPSEIPALDRELTDLLVYLGEERVIQPALAMMETARPGAESELTPEDVLARSDQYGPTVKAMLENRPAEQGLALAMALSHMENGWTSESREKYFKWFYDALDKSGGMSYAGFVEFIRLQALANVPPSERERLAEISGEALLNKPSYDPDLTPPEGPGRNWTLSEAMRAVNNDNYQPELVRGEELYRGLLCASCHAINGQGGNVGPDLTQAGTRFSKYDLLMSMISPSSSISDQYAATLYTLSDGNTLIGRTVRTTEDSIYININPYITDNVALARNQIQSEKPSPVSLMPGGLINSLNEDELRDLMAYLVAEK